ncbi:MAG: glycosyltransferase [Bacteroidetes bacterium]|nr:glycosyltransferase [Bacteroidota bacterium]
MPAIFFICFLLTLAYTALMLVYRHGWDRQAYFKVGDLKPLTRVSIVIPARNEAGNIERCIRSLLSQSYLTGLYEIIVVDDFSEDATVDVVKSFIAPNVKCLQLSDYLKADEIVNAYKKRALSTGVSQSTGELIVTTDADCLAARDWLATIVAYYEKYRPVMIIAPVSIDCNNSILQRFQSIDFMGMQGITAAAQRLKLGNMANGANLAFSKAAFESVDGYSGTEHLASGDDYLLMVKMQEKYPGKLAYLKSKDAIMRTAPQYSWAGFLQQRIRWASKSGKYKDNRLTAILGLVYFFNFAIAVLLIAGLFNFSCFLIGGGMLCWKIISELIFLFPVSGFFNKRKQLFIFTVLQPLHIIYIISAGFLGLIGIYKWKGRRVR